MMGRFLTSTEEEQPRKSNVNLSKPDPSQQQELSPVDGRLTAAVVAQAIRQMRDASEAKAAFDWASARPGFKHDEHSCAALVSVYVKCRLFRPACKLMSRNDKLWARNRVALSTMASAYCYIGNTEAALLVLREMERLGLPVETALHNELISALCRAGRPVDAARHFETMVANREADAASYEAAARALCGAGAVAPAVDLLLRMEAEVGAHAEVATWNAVVRHVCRLRAELAAPLVQHMVDLGRLPNAETYRWLALACLRGGAAGDVAACSGHLRQMADMGHHVDGDTVDALATGLCRAGRPHHAQELLDALAPAAASWREVVGAHARAGSTDEAQRQLQKMIARGVQVDGATYSKVIRAVCRQGKLGEAQRLLSEMVARGCRPPSAATYAALAAAYCAAGSVSGGYHVVRHMLQRGVPPDTATSDSVIHFLHRRGRPWLARDLTKRLPPSND